MTVTVTPQTRLNLFVVVETMITRRVIEYGNDGVRAIAATRKYDAEHLTRSVALFNRVPNKEGQLEAVLVWQSIDTLPRWMTLHAKQAKVIPFPERSRG